jgi:hypothetical protein
MNAVDAYKAILEELWSRLKTEDMFCDFYLRSNRLDLRGWRQSWFLLFHTIGTRWVCQLHIEESRLVSSLGCAFEAYNPHYRQFGPYRSFQISDPEFPENVVRFITSHFRGECDTETSRTET